MDFQNVMISVLACFSISYVSLVPNNKYKVYMVFLRNATQLNNRTKTQEVRILHSGREHALHA